MKKKLLYIFLLDLIFFIFILGLKAQPATTGCHFAHQHVRTEPLTAFEKRQVRALIERSDTFDVVHYDIQLDVTQFDQRKIYGTCAVSFTAKMAGIDYFNLDLLDLNISRIHSNGLDLPFARQGFNVVIEWPETMTMGDTNTVVVEYNGTPTVSQSSFGGFYFEAGYAYNLGIDLIGQPHNFGRSWFPCFDNFVERATYQIALKTRGGRSGYAVGDFLGETAIGGDTIVRTYHMQKQLPSYLVGVAVSNYEEDNFIHSSAYGDIPVQIVAKPEDLSDARNSMAFLPDAIDCLEYWYGPYIWNRVGYVITLRGAMEHASSIAYPDNSISGGQLSTRLMTHELCHHWWGNIITVNYAPDMWIKEGNAEYGAHLIEEFIGGKEPFRETVRNNHFFVMTTAHEEDGDYLALSPLSQENTYGRHTYYRGASMLHNMRAYLGDSLFRFGQQTLLNENAYSYLNAQAYRDKMTTASGVDMEAYFDDWIFSPGYADYYLHSFEYSPLITQLKVVIGQNQYHSGHYHRDAPVPITLHFADGSTQDYRVNISGALDSVYLSVIPFEPIGISINRGHIMNLAMFEDAVTVSESGQYKDSYSNYRWNVDNVLDTFSYVVENHLTGAGGIVDEEKYRMSDNHFWHITGNHEDQYEGSLLLFYDDNAPLSPDEQLTGMSEDSIVLMYRADASHEWKEYEHYTKIAFIPTDGKGSMNLSVVKNGDYTFANLLDDDVATKEYDNTATIDVFPNPASEFLNISTENNQFDHLQIFSIDGALLYHASFPTPEMQLSIKEFGTGEFIVFLSNDEKYATKTFVTIQ